MRVDSEKQTLILAGEAVPARVAPHVERVAMLVVEAQYAAIPRTACHALPISAGPPPAPRPISAGSITADVSAYARTQMLSGGRTRRHVIDTYA